MTHVPKLGGTVRDPVGNKLGGKGGSELCGRTGALADLAYRGFRGLVALSPGLDGASNR